MKPIRNFGIEAGLGVMLTFVVAITLFPSMLLFKRIPADLRSTDPAPENGRGWPRLLDWISASVERSPRAILIITALICLASIPGIMFIDRNNYVLGYYSSKSDFRKDVTFFEQEFAGIRIFNMAVLPVAGKKVNDPDVLQETEKLQQYLQTIPSLGTMFSPVTVYKTFNKIYHGGVMESYRLPQE